jgi:hypothetical protein
MPPIVAAGPLVIITIRSDRRTASSTSCVTISTVLPVAATILTSSSCSRARVSASSAPNGSSSSSTFGCIASARAIPDALLHAAGYFVRELVLGMREPDELEGVAGSAVQVGLRFALAEHSFHGQMHVVEAREPRQEGVILEDDAAVRAGPAISRPRTAAGRGWA